MKFRLAFILILLAVNARGQGLILNDEAYRHDPLVAASDGAKGENDLSKNTFKVDLKPYCPTVGAQGRVSSCVGWSVGYAAMTIETAIINGWAGDRKTIDENAFSAMFVYNQIKLGDCFFGAELSQAFGILREKGNVHYRDFAVGNNCDSLPPGILVERARANKVKDFAALFDPDDKGDVKIERVKQTLVNRKPVVIGMVVLENFLSLKSSDHVWYPGVGKTDVFGGHAMVVIGYDDGKRAFEVMNSWGEGWANKGFVWIRYEDFATYCKYAYQLVMTSTASTHLEGTVRVLRPVYKTLREGGVDVGFSSLNFRQAENQYLLDDGKVTLPLEFQLEVADLRKDSYLYVISFNNAFKPTVHWPRDEKLNKQFAGEHESPLLTAHRSAIITPGKYNVFMITKAGTEYLCILNANYQVKNIPEKLRQIANMKGPLGDRIRQAFGIKSQAHSELEGDRITFLSNGDKGGIVSVLLKFEVE